MAISVFGLPVDVEEGQAAAAAAGKGVRGDPLSSQGLVHPGLPPEEVRDQTHELEQRYGVVPVQRRAEEGENERAGEDANVGSESCGVKLRKIRTGGEETTHSEAMKLQREEERGT